MTILRPYFVLCLKPLGMVEILQLCKSDCFSTRQSPGETVVDCSLKLVEIYNKVAEKDPAYESRQDQTLKERLAASVADQSLSREIRRLIQDAPGVEFL